MYYVVVGHEIYVCSREKAEEICENAKAEFRDTFVTTNEYYATVVRDGNIAESYFRGEMF